MKNILLFRKPSVLLFWSFALLVMLMPGIGFGQVTLTNGAPSSTINFSTSVSGVNNGAYNGTGFQATPSAGQLDSDAWAVTGWSNGALAFGGTQTTAATDYTRGVSAVAVTTGGFYSFTGSPGSAGNPSFMIQPGGSDFAPGTLTLRVLNNGTTNLTELSVSYNLFVRNDQGRSSSFNFSHSADNSTYTAVGALDYTSTATLDALGWIIVGAAPKTTTITGLNIAPGSFYYIRWSSADVGGSGSRDEFGLDDISLTGTYSGVCTSQTIAALSTPVTKTFGDPSYSVFTTASPSGLTVTYGTSNGTVATVDGSGNVTIQGVGTAIITASQAGDLTYCAAPNVTQSLTVVKATPTITTNPTASDITFGQTLAASNLTGGAASVPGSFAFTPSNIAPNAGTASYTVTFTPTQGANYNTVTTSVSVTTLKAASTITATGFQSLEYNGLPQGPDTSNVTGSAGLVSYSYSGTSYGAVSYGPFSVRPFDAGDYSVVASVAEDTNYLSASSVPYTFTIAKASLTVTADNKTAVQFTAIPPFTVSYTGFQNLEDEADLITAPTATSPTANINIVGNYDIVPAGGASDNYSFNYVNGNFSVTSAAQPVCPSGTAIAPIGNQTVCEGSTATTLTATFTTNGLNGTPTVQYQWYYNFSDSNTVVGAAEVLGATSSTFTPSTTELETRFYFCVAYAADNDCAQNSTLQTLASNTVRVEVIDTPEASITPDGPTTFCAGNDVILTASAADSYLWSNGATTQAITVTTTGSYSVQVTTNGCQSPISTATDVTVNSLPATPTITPSGATTFCDGGSVTLTSSAGDTYLWSNDADTQAIAVTSSGTYSVQVIDGNGCLSNPSDEITVTVSSPLVVGNVQGIITGTPGPNVVISQIYGGGGNTGATYRNDFVELFNPTLATVNLAGYSIQYSSATGTGNFAVNAISGGSIAPGKFFLIQLATGGANGALLSGVDLVISTSVINLSATTGKVALVSNTTPITGACPSLGAVVDYVGFGTTANCAEGTRAAAPSNTTSLTRTNLCTDTNNNVNDFSAGAITIRNGSLTAIPCATSSSTETICSGSAPTAVTVSAASGSTGPYTYQWYSFNGITTAPNGSTIPGTWTLVGSGTTFSPTALTQDTTFACFVTPTGCAGAWATGQRQVTVQAATASAGTNGTLSICAGVTVTTSQLFAALGGSPAANGAWSPALAGAGVYTYTQTGTAPCSNNTATVTVSEVANLTWYRDADNDSYGNVAISQSNCVNPSTVGVFWVLNSTDCNDGDAAVNPGATEINFNSIDDNCLNGLFDGHAPVVVNVTTPSGALSSMTSPITCSVATNTTPYSGGAVLHRFRVTRTSPAAVETINSPTRTFSISQLGIAAHSATYLVEATAVVNGEEQPYNGTSQTYTTPAAPQIPLTTQTGPVGVACAYTLARIDSYVYANNTTTYGANKFEFAIERVPLDGEPVYTTTVAATVPYFKLTSISAATMPITYGTTYKIRVRYGYDSFGSAVWSDFGAECLVTTPALTLSQIVGCGGTVASLNAYIYTSTAPGANLYEFKVTRVLGVGETLTGPASETLQRVTPFFKLNMLTSLFVGLQKEYAIEVRYRVNSYGTQQWSGWSHMSPSTCSVFTPNFPTTTMNNVQCAIEGFTPAENQNIYAEPIAGASAYRFQMDAFIDDDSNPVTPPIHSSEYVDSPNNYVKLNQYTTLYPGITYAMTVAVAFYGEFGPLDRDCAVTVPGTPAKMGVAAARFAAKAYPNPFANNFMIEVTTEDKSAVGIKVYDMVGRLVDEQAVQVTDLKTSTIGDRYPSGVYNVVITQGDVVQTLRVIKR